MKTSQFIIEQLCDQVLTDTDWGLEPVVMDADPERGTVVEGLTGIQENKSIDV